MLLEPLSVVSDVEEWYRWTPFCASHPPSGRRTSGSSPSGGSNDAEGSVLLLDRQSKSTDSTVSTVGRLDVLHFVSVLIVDSLASDNPGSSEDDWIERRSWQDACVLTRPP